MATRRSIHYLVRVTSRTSRFFPRTAVEIPFDFRNIETFYWVAQLRSFSRAAEKLNTTQPAVSQRITNLEHSLKVKLFERNSKTTSVTAKGRELHDFAERILRLVGEMTEAVAAPESRSGLVRLGVSETLVHTWLSTFIERVHATYPLVTLDIEVNVTSHLRNALVEGRLDLGFLLGPVSEPTMTNLSLSSYPLAFVAKRGDVETAPGGIVPMETLLARPIITYPTTTKPYIALREILNRSRGTMPRIYSNSSLSTIVRMTLDGIGVSVIPPIVVGREIARGELTVLRTEIALPNLDFTATTQLTPDRSLNLTLATLACAVAAEHDAHLT